MKNTLQKLEQGKLYYSISEVCRMTGLEPHVLRYWETEFAQMRPRKNRAGNRAYRLKEIQYIHYIRFLLHDEKYTLQGAKKKLGEVTPEEIAGQTSLLRISAPAPAAVPNPEGKETPIRGGASGLPASAREELLAIRDGLRDTLRLLEK